MSRNIYLTGPRAAGKTTTGRRVAELLNLEFIDTDVYLGDLHQTTVAEVVAQFGWEEFRRMEAEVLVQTSAGGSKVVATGGGMILAEPNRDLMRERGLVFYLSAPAEVLAERLTRDPQAARRPSLTGQSVVEEVAQVLAQREAIYRAVAHQVIDAAAPFDEVVAEIVRLIKAMG